MTKDEIVEAYPDILLMDGYDDAIMGICHQFGKSPFVAYSLVKVIDRLMKDGMTEEEAMEYFEYNQLGAYVGDGTPVFVE